MELALKYLGCAAKIIKINKSNLHRREGERDERETDREGGGDEREGGREGEREFAAGSLRFPLFVSFHFGQEK